MEALGVTDANGDSTAADKPDHLEILLIPSDGEGNMPLLPTCIAKTYLPLAALRMILSRAGYSQTIALPVTLLGSGKRSSLHSPVEVNIALSHRIVPTSIQQQRHSWQHKDTTKSDISVVAPPQSDMSLQPPLQRPVQEQRPHGSAPHQLVVKVSRVVHLPEHEYTVGEKNVYVTCSLKNSAIDRAVSTFYHPLPLLHSLYHCVSLHPSLA